MPQPQERVRNRRSAHDGYRAVLAALLLLFVLAATFSDGRLFPSLTGMARQSQDAEAQVNDAESDDELRTGSILIVPAQGNVCRQKLIDNATWHIRDNGFVLCDDAVSWRSDRGAGRSGARIEAIRDGFFPKR
jgi:hypothetical protein